jgi:Ca-activated chloride channel family protein
MKIHKSNKIAAAVLSIIGTCYVSVLAQDQPVSIETNLVTLNVSVTDKNGGHVRGLSKSDFVVTDNGRAQDIDIFSADESGLSIGIVYDMHPSTNERTASVLEALKRFTSRLGDRDNFFVTVFNDKGSLTTEFVPDMDQLERHLANPDRNTPNSLYDAIFASGDRVGRLRNPKKYLLIVTEGGDRNSHHSLKELRLRLRSVNLPVYALTFTPDDRMAYGYTDVIRNGPRQLLGVGTASELDRNVLSEISRTTGGQAVESNIRNRVYLAALATQLLEEARSQYVIGFYPETNDGRWHKLAVKIDGAKAKGLKISSRKGYQSRRG